jgi:Tol biopolymer transport system component
MRGRRAKLRAPALSVTWLSAGKLLASVGRGEDTDIWVVAPSGRGHELEWLTKAADGAAVETEKELVVSPNGRTLLFSGEGSSEHHGNYVVDLRARRMLPLVGDADDAPAFAPDGRTIAYQHATGDGNWDLCLAKLANVSLQGASHARCFSYPRGNDREPAFLPGGHQLVFSSDRAARRSGVSALYLLDRRTGGVRRLTRLGFDATSPKVAPDGRSVVFVRRALVRFR